MDTSLKTGGTIGAAIGAVAGGAFLILCGLGVIATAPISVPVGAAIVLGTAAVGAVVGASTGK